MDFLNGLLKVYLILTLYEHSLDENARFEQG